MKRVILIYAPISNRMWSKGDEGLIDNDKIRINGCWFDFDDRYNVEYL